jgi:hypothetical protein
VGTSFIVFLMFKFYIDDKKMYWLLLLCPFFHGGLWVFVGIFLIAKFFGHYEKLWIVFYIISFFLSSIAMDLLNNLSSIINLPTFFENFLGSYNNMERVEYDSENLSARRTAIFIELSSLLRRFLDGIMMLLLIRNRNIMQQEYRNLFRVLLVTMCFATLFSSIPTLGGRIFSICYPLIAYLWLTIFGNARYKILPLTIPLIFATSYLIKFYILSYTLDKTFWISPPLFLIYKYVFMPIA